MKKHALFFLLVLAISSTAFGFCRVNIAVTDPVFCGAESINVSGRLCCTGNWELDDYCITRFGNQIFVDVYLNCSCLSGCECQCGTGSLDIPGCPLRPGLYVLAVRVWCIYEGCQCWPFNLFCQPIFAGQGTTTFYVCCNQVVVDGAAPTSLAWPLALQ
jgi:hypothetical protein